MLEVIGYISLFIVAVFVYFVFVYFVGGFLKNASKNDNQSDNRQNP